MEEGNVNQNEREQKTRQVVTLVTLILLGLITLATAWSGYQAASWASKAARSFARSSVTRSDSVKLSLTANQLTLFDIQMFIQWLNANSQNNTQLANFYHDHMRAEAKPAFEAWLAQDPFNNPNAPTSPFAMEQYVVQTRIDSDEAEKSAADLAAEANVAGEVSGGYILNAVILASALFFTGLSARFASVRVELVLAILASALTLYGIFRLISLWVNYGV